MVHLAKVVDFGCCFETFPHLPIAGNCHRYIHVVVCVSHTLKYRIDPILHCCASVMRSNYVHTYVTATATGIVSLCLGMDWICGSCECGFGYGPKAHKRPSVTKRGIMWFNEWWFAKYSPNWKSYKYSHNYPNWYSYSYSYLFWYSYSYSYVTCAEMLRFACYAVDEITRLQTTSKWQIVVVSSW